MITFDELNEQNHNIAELSNVLERLMGDRFMCDNEVTVELFLRYIDRVREHLDVEDKQLYSPLLAHRDHAVNKTAKLFLSGSAEIKRLFQAYVKKWCKKRAMTIKNHEAFVADTKDLFRMVLSRITDETENLYPLIRRVGEDKRYAA